MPPCDITITGPSTAIAPTDGILWLGLDLDLGPSLPPSRSVSVLTGSTLISSTSNGICSGVSNTTTFPNSWAWLLYPLETNPLAVSDDGRSIEANLTQTAASSAPTVHTIKLTAMRE